MHFNILYFDDQIDHIDIMQVQLEENFKLIGETDNSKFEDCLKTHRPHGILLDLHMPILDGIELYSKIIASDHYNGCPIFFISGDASHTSRLKMIQSGGVDVFDRLVKPSELKIRLNNKIRLFLQGRTVIEIGNLRLDTNLFTLNINERAVDLTLIEMRILSVLMRKIPDPVPKTEVMEKIWGDPLLQSKLSVHLSNIKAKLYDWSHEIKIRENLISISRV